MLGVPGRFLCSALPGVKGRDDFWVICGHPTRGPGASTMGHSSCTLLGPAENSLQAKQAWGLHLCSRQKPRFDSWTCPGPAVTLGNIISLLCSHIPMLNFGFAVLIYTAGPPGMLWESEPGVSGWVFRSDGILFSPSVERFNLVKTNKNIPNLSPRRKCWKI